MPTLAIRVDLSSQSRDFQRVAVLPGYPLLDQSHSSASTLHKWLGRLAAEPQWDRETVLFHVKNDDGSMPKNVVCRPATVADLRGPLQPELESLRKRLQEAKPNSANETSLHRFVTNQLEQQVNGLDAGNPSGSFLKYRDQEGKTRLTWCWGYQPKASGAASAMICFNTECRLISMPTSGTSEKCPRCGTPLHKRRLLPTLVAAVLVFIVIGAGFYGASWYRSTFSTETDVAGEPSDTVELPTANELAVAARAAAHSSLNGLVLDRLSGRPIADALVSITASNHSITSDPKGRFHIDGLDQDSVEFTVSADGYVTQKLTKQLSFKQDEKASVDVKLDGNTTLSGRVVDEHTQKPVDRATVSIGDLPVSDTTNRQGVFRIEGLEGGMQVTVIVSAVGYQNQSFQETLLAEGNRAESNRKEIAILVPLIGNATLKGSVFDEASDAPISAAKVSFVRSSRTTTTDEKGDFHIPGVRSGPAEIEVVAAGYALKREKLELRSAAETSVRINLMGEAILVGRVIDTVTERGITSATVAVVGSPHKVETKEDGHFRITGCRSGPATIEATAPGYPLRRIEHDLAVGKESEILVKLVGESLLVGDVIDSVTDRPVSDASVTILANSRTEKTDADGNFRIDRAPSGVIEFEIDAPGYLKQQLARKLVADQHNSVRVRLVGDGFLSGKVIEADTGKPIRRAQVTIAGSKRAIDTDDQGRFQIEGTRSGSTELLVAAEGYVTQRSEQRLAAAKQTTVVIELQKKPATAEKTAEEEIKPWVEFFGIKSRASSVGFVVDCSGSMSGHRIRRMKAELANSIIDLNPKQRFYVSFFNSSAVPMPGDSAVEALPLEKVRAYNWMKTIDAEGGTNPEPALQFVAGLKPDVIYLLSDGEFDDLSEETVQLFQKNKIVVNAFAFEDESGAKRLQKIAQRTGGSYRFVPVGDLPPNYELMLDTRLAMLLIGALDDLPPSDPQQYRKALVEYCDAEDFGPRPGATELETKQAMDDWLQWWGRHKLLPLYEKLGDGDLLADMRNPLMLRRWAALIAAGRRKLDAPGDFITSLRDHEPYVRDAAHQALVALAGKNYGSIDGASKEERDKSINEWQKWLQRKKVIDAFPNLPASALVSRFDHIHPDIKAAAFAEAAERRLKKPDKFIAALDDASIEVRNAVHEALVQMTNGQIDFGPAPNADAAQWADAQKKWKVWRGEQLERQAQGDLRLARILLKNKDATVKQNGKRRLQEIIDEYPTTGAARDARQALDGGN